MMMMMMMITVPKIIVLVYVDTKILRTMVVISALAVVMIMSVNFYC